MKKESKKNLCDAAKALIRAKKVVIVIPRDPDGDTLGCLLALGLALMDQGKKVTLWCGDAIPTRYQYLPGSELVGAWSYEKPDVSVAVRSRAIHIGRRGLEGAFGEVAHDLLRAMKADITSAIATCLHPTEALA